MAPGAVKREPHQNRGAGDDLRLGLPAALRAEYVTIGVCLHISSCVSNGGTGRTRTDTPESTDERISNPPQFPLCLLFRVRVHFCSAPIELHRLQSCELRLTLIVTQYDSPVTM